MKKSQKSSKTKLQRASLGAVVSFFGAILLACGNMIVNPIVINNLGIDAFGLYSLVFGFLSIVMLVDNGSHHSLIQALYEPLSQKNFALVKAINKFQIKWYRNVGFAFIGLGIIIAPFLGFSVESNRIFQAYVIFALLLVRFAFDYILFVGKRLILFADIRQYIFESINLSFSLVSYILKIIVVLAFHNIILFVIVEVTVLSTQSLFIKILAGKMFGFIDKEKEIELPKNVKQKIIKLYTSSFAFSILSISFTLYTICLSFSINLEAVGLFSLYVSTLITAICGIFYKPLDALVPAIGQSLYLWSKSEASGYYHQFRFLTFSMNAIITTGMFVCLKYFIPLWAGEQCLISDFDIILVCIWFFIGYNGHVFNRFLFAYGLQWRLLKANIFALLLRIITCFVFIIIFRLGITGALFSMIITMLITECGTYQYILEKDKLGGVIGFYKNLEYQVFYAVQCAVIMLICHILDVFVVLDGNFLNFFVKGLICVLISIVLLLTFNCKNRYFISFYNIFVKPNIGTLYTLKFKR